MDSFLRLLDTCARTLSRYENVAAESAVLAAISGGMDSTLLLLALTRLREEGRLPGPLRVAHVDHGVRPDSAANAQHVAELCDRLEVPCQIEHLRWSQSETPGEDALRDARYAALEACARDVGARMLVTAHHADDNLETVLFRMLRGTGPRGLAGIPESRWLGDDAYPLLLVRPMLRTRRTTIESLIERFGEQPFHDVTNDDVRLARNELRHRTIPSLRKRMGIGLDVAIMTVASTARAANEIVEAQALRVLSQRTRSKTPWRLELDLKGIDVHSMPFVREAMRQSHVRMHALGAAPPTVWLDRVMGLLDMDAGKRVAGRGGLMVERLRDGLLLVDTDRAGAPPAAESELPQLVVDGGEAAFGETEWTLSAFSHPTPPLTPQPSEAGPLRALLDPRSCPGPWRMRTRRAGDRFQPLGCDEQVELRRFLQSRHVPRYDRDRLPIVVDAEDRVLWIPGVEVSEAAKLRLNTRQCVELRATCGVATELVA
ncbi:MAG: tRNA lysidine(34) synthetase TilS [Planctomycetota bacterium]|nr:tRNA lysidine(34) synthetase TilS [Planctomycetota bacterium]